MKVLALARYGESVGAPPPPTLRRMLLTTDHVPAPIVGAMERARNCVVYNHYGMTEMGLGGGVECQARRGYHLREADLHFESVHPATGDSLPDGERGEIVLTTLTRPGMPLIRYRTGNVGCFLPGDCPCGTLLKTLGQVRERLNGRIEIGAASCLTMADLDEALFPIAGLLDFSATLAREGPGIACTSASVWSVGRARSRLRPFSAGCTRFRRYSPPRRWANWMCV